MKNIKTCRTRFSNRPRGSQLAILTLSQLDSRQRCSEQPSQARFPRGNRVLYIVNINNEQPISQSSGPRCLKSGTDWDSASPHRLLQCPKTISDKLQRLLNAGARVVSGTLTFDRGLTQLIHADLHWLDVPERINRLSMITHRYLPLGALHVRSSLRDAPQGSVYSSRCQSSVLPCY